MTERSGVRATLAEPAPSGMVTSAGCRGALITLVVLQAAWLAVWGALTVRPWFGLPAWLFVAAGLVAAVATLVGWLRLAFEAAMGVAFLAYLTAVLTGLIGAGVQVYHLLAGHPGRPGGTLGWMLLATLWSLVTGAVVLGMLVELDERQGTVLRHAQTVERLAGPPWFGAGPQPPELLVLPLEIPGVYACELTSGKGFRYALVGAERVVLISLTAPDDPADLAAEASSWQDRLRAAHSAARVRCVLVVSPEEAPGPPAGWLLTLGVAATTADGLLDTVGPWLGEPAHVDVPIAALLLPKP
jgi:hypothetical protein